MWSCPRGSLGSGWRAQDSHLHASPLRSSHCALLASGLWTGLQGVLGAGVAQAAVSWALKEASLWASFSACEFKATLGPSPVSGPAWGLEESRGFWLIRKKRLPSRCTWASLFSGEVVVSGHHLPGSSPAKRCIPLPTERMCVEGEGRRGEARGRQAKRGELAPEGPAHAEPGLEELSRPHGRWAAQSPRLRPPASWTSRHRPELSLSLCNGPDTQCCLE